MEFSIQSLISLAEENAEELTRVLNIHDTDFLECPDDDGLTLLHYSVIYGQTSVMRYLLSMDCDVDAQDLLGRTPLMLALKVKNEEAMQILLEAGANMFILNHKKKSVLHKFFKEHSLKASFCEIFLQELHKRCSSSEKMAQMMIDAGCNVYQAAFTKDAKIIEYLLKQGLRIDSLHPEDKTTALHVAVFLKDVESVELLLKYGVDVNALCSVRYSPLNCVYSYVKKHTAENIRILKILLDHGASPMLLGPMGFFQMTSILRQGNSEAIRTLFQSIVDFTAKDRNKNNILHYLASNTNSGVTENLKMHINKIDINEFNELGSSPLHDSIRYTNVEMVKFLLEQNAETNRPDGKFKYTPLFHAYSVLKSNELNDRNIELLLQHNADPQYILTQESGKPLTIFDLQKFGYRDQVKPVIAHLAVLERLGTPIVEIIHSQINAQDTFSDYFTECREILQKKVVTSVTVFKLLTATKRRMAQYIGNKRLILKLKRLSYSQKIKSSFPYYWNTLSQRLSRGIEYRRLRNKAAGVISNIFEDCHLHKTDLIVDKTMDYLDNQDLQQLGKLQELIN